MEKYYDKTDARMAIEKTIKDVAGVDYGDQVGADARVKLAGLDVSWLIPVGTPSPSAEMSLFRPPNVMGRLAAAPPGRQVNL